jgi:hypothetical protein
MLGEMTLQYSSILVSKKQQVFVLMPDNRRSGITKALHIVEDEGTSRVLRGRITVRNLN